MKKKKPKYEHNDWYESSFDLQEGLEVSDWDRETIPDELIDIFEEKLIVRGIFREQKPD